MKIIPIFLVFLAAFLSAQAESVDFSLESPEDGKTLRAADLRGKYVAIHFLLKTECPICLKHTHDYATKGSSLTNVVQVFVKPDSAAEIKAWAKKLKGSSDVLPGTVYQDPDAKLAKALKIPDGYAFHGETVHYPALVLLNPQGNEVFRYVGKNNNDRYSFEKLSAKIAELTAK